jgi:hypothetical protein
MDGKGTKGRDLKMPAMPVINQPIQHRWAVELRKTEPIDGSRLRDQCGGSGIPNERVVLNVGDGQDHAGIIRRNFFLIIVPA